MRIKRDYIVLFILMFIIGFSLGTLTTSQSGVFVLSPTTLAKEYDVLIFRDGEDAIAVDNYGQVLAKSTNHSYVIQFAIDYVPQGGKIVLRGNFTVSKPIVISKSDIIISGFARLTLASGVDDSMFKIIGDDVHHVVLEHLLLDGNKAGNTAGHGIYIDTSAVAVPQIGGYHVLYDIVIQNFAGSGVYIVSGVEHKLINVHSLDNDGFGFYLHAFDIKCVSCVAGRNGAHGFDIAGYNIQLVGCKSFRSNMNDGTFFNYYIYNSGRITLTNCESQDGEYGAHGIVVYNSFDINIVGCELDGNEGDGIKLDTVTRATITGNVITVKIADAPNHLNGINVINSAQIAIIGNTIWSVKQNGIRIYNSYNVTVKGNVIVNPSGDNYNVYDGILLSNSEKVIVSGNTITDENGNMKYGIEEYLSNFNIIIANIVSGYVTGSIKIAGANTTSVYNMP